MAADGFNAQTTDESIRAGSVATRRRKCHKFALRQADTVTAVRAERAARWLADVSSQSGASLEASDRNKIEFTMTPRDAAKIIMTTIVSSGQPETHMPLDTLAEELIDGGMDIDDIEDGLNAGLDWGWFLVLGSDISVTTAGELVNSPTPDTYRRTLH